MKQRRFGLRARLCAALMLLLVALPMCANAATETYAVVSGTQTLNLRAGASTSSQWLGAYPRGAWVTVTGGQNNFYAVITADNKAGYMSKNFLSATDQFVYGNIAIVNNNKTTAFLNLRAYPSFSAQVIAILYNGVPLTILSEQNGWYRVQMGDTVGYVRSEYTTLSYQPIGAGVATIKTPNNTSVNMRTRPDGGAPVRRQFTGDRYVSVLLKGNGWWYVCIDRYLGFISSDFLVDGLHAARDDNAPLPDTDSYAIVKNPVSTQKLNLRALPSLGASVTARLGNGYRLSVVVQGTQWCKVFADSYAATGYVQTKYIALYNLPVTPKLSIENPGGARVNLYDTASLAGNVVTRVPDGAQAVVVAPGPDWSLVKYGGKTGYVQNKLTSIAN